MPNPESPESLPVSKDAIPLWLKRGWITWVGMVLGPFALWFALLGKWRRRGLVRSYPMALLTVWGLSLLAYALLFALPLPHLLLVVLYAAGVLVSTYFIFRVGGLELFHFGPVTRGIHPEHNASFGATAVPGPASHSTAATASSQEPKSLVQSLTAACLVILPLAYLGGLFRNLFELRAFSIQWPGSVYIDALKWAAAGLPVALFLGWLLWRSPLQARVRTLLVFFAGLASIALWAAFWSGVDQRLLDFLWGGIREPLLFDPWVEQHYRHAVQIFFFASGGLLGIDYLMLSASAGLFLRRALFLGLPAGLAYAQMLFFLGDWNYYLGAIQSTLLREQQLKAYGWIAASRTSRVPEAFRTPYDLEELAEYRYQSGDTQTAITLWNRMRRRLVNRPYASGLKLRAEHYLGHLLNGGSDAIVPVPPSELALRLIRPATYLDADWYALLSAVGYLRPDWTDLEIKKRLLSVSSGLQMNLPPLSGIPAMRTLLDRLGIAHRAGFADGARLREALRRGIVPFVNVDGNWVAVSGYDAARDAYTLYRYPEHYERNPWWGAPELEVLGGPEAPAGKGLKNDSGHVIGNMEPARAESPVRVPIKRAMPAPELERNLHDIGGVCVFLGDSSWIPEKEDRAAFLVELGDAFYQEQENDKAAAEAYAEAIALWPNDYVACRILYLKRRWQARHQDPGDYGALYRRPGLPPWARLVPLDSATVARVTDRILSGAMGQYLLLNWVAGIPPLGAPLHESRLDSAERAYALLRQLEPSQALYLDTLAALAHRRGHFAEETLRLDTLSRYHPFGDQDVQFRLAWAAFLAEDTARALKALGRSPNYRHQARYDLIAGAIACGRGHRRKGRAMLERSLKQDKTEPRIHHEWLHCQEPIAGGRQPAYLETWEKRTR